MTELDRVVTTSPNVLSPEQLNSNTTGDISGQDSLMLQVVVLNYHSKILDEVVNSSKYFTFHFSQFQQLTNQTFL